MKLFPNRKRAIDDWTADARERYLSLVKAALLDLHYLDNEARLEYLLSLPVGTPPDQERMRDPARTLEIRFKRLAQARTTGAGTSNSLAGVPMPYCDMSPVALDFLQETWGELHARSVPGDAAECGVGRGGGGIFVRACFEAYAMTGRRLWMIDPYRADVADLNQVRDGFERFDLLDDRVRFLQGDYAATLADHRIGPLAFLRIGRSVRADEVGTILERLLPLVSVGGTVAVAGTGRRQTSAVIEELASGRVLQGQPVRVDWDTMAWTVTAPPRRSPRASVGSAPAPRRVPLAPSVESQGVALSVVVVFHDMTREAARTLHSLSRSYQRGVEDLVYEVVAVDNGSHPGQQLQSDDVAAYGSEFRLISTDGPASPTVALNRGIAESRGDAVALMIDGAHVLTPGVFRHALAAMDTYAPAVVAIQQWYVGPGQQGDAQQAGYDQAAEDRLFGTIGWPIDGYRLFEIGHFIGDRDWFDGIVESNCLFAPRAVLEQVGGFDDSFAMPGGGYANLELFERLHSHPGITPTSVLGEGTFHQFHGGTTTNVADEAVRRQRIFSYGEHFRETRGRGLRGLNKPVHYVGSMDTKAARRTRSRREFRLAFDKERDPVSTTESRPVPVPEELKVAAIEAMWNQQGWRETTWLGHPVARYPTDLHTYQELMQQLEPDAVLLVGDDAGLGGRALFAASILDLLDHGRVVAVGQEGAAPRPPHRRITYLSGPGDSPDCVAAAKESLAGDEALVFLGLGAVDRVVAAFEAYAAVVPVGGFIVIENTIMNGRPAAPEFGPGPHEAVTSLLQRHSDFVPDVAFERYAITFNRNGYLRRISTVGPASSR